MKKLILLMLVCWVKFSPGQDLLSFSLQAREGAGITPVSVSLDGIHFNADTGRVVLYEVLKKSTREIPCQVETGIHNVLWFLFDHSSGNKNYLLRHENNPSSISSPLTLKTGEKGTTLYRNSSPVLTYNHVEFFPPEGVDIKYKRSAFIHPLWSPGGEVLTNIQPKDHYHHYGIWNPWTMTTIDGKEVDFWNLMKGEGTVRFGGYLDGVQGLTYAGFKVLQEHVYFPAKGTEKIAMNEVWDIRLWESGIPGITMVDVTSTLNTPLPKGILLDAYRYGGGIGYRATARWHKDNCSVLTSEAKERAQADGTNARWCIVEGESGVKEGRSGILFLSHPSNRMHPEPMRVWPLDQNSGRGDLFFEFCPIRHRSWNLEPGKNYTLKYRLVVFDGKMTPEEAEKYWKAFAYAPAFILTK